MDATEFIKENYTLTNDGAELMNIDKVIKEIDLLSSEIGYMGIDSIKDDYSAQQALDLLKQRIKQKIPMSDVAGQSEQK